MELGNFVREKRRGMRLTQQQLADMAGVGLNFVYQLEKNKQTVQLDCTKQVLDALGYEIEFRPKLMAAQESLFPARKGHPAPSPWAD